MFGAEANGLRLEMLKQAVLRTAASENSHRKKVTELLRKTEKAFLKFNKAEQMIAHYFWWLTEANIT